MVPSSDEETKSNDSGLHPRKMHKTVSMAKLLGGIGDVLGDMFFVPGQKERVLVPSSSVTPPSPFTGSFPVDIGFVFVFGGASGTPGGSSQPEKPTTVCEGGSTSHSLSFEAYDMGRAITRNSLLSEDITARE